MALGCLPLAQAQAATVHSRYAQYRAPRQYMQRLGPQYSRPAPAPRTATPAPAPAVTNAPVASPHPPPLVTAAAPDPEKAREEKEASARKTADFVKQRAEAGSATAQYDLGKRYMTGDGIEKNFTEARKWLEAAAKQGEENATSKLEVLAKMEEEAAAKK
jgi:TPR repeat protein